MKLREAMGGRVSYQGAYQVDYFRVARQNARPIKH